MGSEDKDLRYKPPQEDQGVKHENGISSHTVYVPVYSHIYFGDGKPYLLTTTLSIRNTDMKRSLIVKSITYYNTKGKLLRGYLPAPIRLGPLASKEVLVEEHDFSGGSGAKFIVEWTAEEVVERPIIEAVMIGASDLRGISFLTTGQEIHAAGAGSVQHPR
ncbi:MAG: DUF3124 domain-containing protein [Deltaproteobacteria bacterium]|nr:DUF3124 domain-containing protein [Deltaproteobacteria bacterium]